MKNKFLLIAALVLLAIPMFSQVSFGLRGGFNSSNVKLSDYTNTDYILEYDKGKLGYHLGVLTQIKLAAFFVQPELLFTTTKSSLAVTDQSGNKDTGYQNFYKLDLPVIGGVKLGPIKFQVGPVASLNFESKSDVLDMNNLEQNINSITIGYQAGVGLQLSSLLIDLKYEGNLSQYGDGMTIGSTTINFDQRISQLILSFGYLF